LRPPGGAALPDPPVSRSAFFSGTVGRFRYAGPELHLATD
jgi:hypothetical protein